MARNILSTRIRQKSQLTPTITEFKIEMLEPNELNFKAGQFMMLNIPPKEGQKRPTLRAYSMSSDANDKSGFTLLIKLVAGGIGSEFLRSKKEREELQFTGPFGKLLFLEPPTSKVVFVATGAGLSQHISFLLTHGAKYPQTSFKMLLGVWNETEVFYKNELTQLKNKLKNFDFDYVLDKAQPGWTGLTGFVTDHLEKVDYKNPQNTFYLCGNPAMINSVTEKLKAAEVDPQRILAEAFS